MENNRGLFFNGSTFSIKHRIVNYSSPANRTGEPKPKPGCDAAEVPKIRPKNPEKNKQVMRNVRATMIPTIMAMRPPFEIPDELDSVVDVPINEKARY